MLLTIYLVNFILTICTYFTGFHLFVYIQDYSIPVFIRQIWTYYRFVQEVNEGENISSGIVLPDFYAASVWRPDAYPDNGKNAKLHEVTMPNVMFRVYTNGTIYYSQRQVHLVTINTTGLQYDKLQIDHIKNLMSVTCQKARTEWSYQQPSSSIYAPSSSFFCENMDLTVLFGITKLQFQKYKKGLMKWFIYFAKTTKHVRQRTNNMSNIVLDFIGGF